MSDTGNKYLNIEVPPQEYDPVEAQSFRYTVQQNFRTTGSEVKKAMDHTESTSSLSLRKYQFMTMGGASV
jgi:hypothetical protein|tara:strand:- start:234 stop:443 length:210 start_codon:yes stop_codon:yes gene_type:complete